MSHHPSLKQACQDKGKGMSPSSGPQCQSCDVIPWVLPWSWHVTEVSPCSQTPSQAKQLGRCALQVPYTHAWRWQWLPRALGSDTKDYQVQIFKLMECSWSGKSVKTNLSLRAKPWHLSVRAEGLQENMSSPKEHRANCMEGAAIWDLATKLQCWESAMFYPDQQQAL